MSIKMNNLRFGPSGVDWQERIDYSRMRLERAMRTKKYMKQAGIPALFLSESENIRYATSIKGVAGRSRGFRRYALIFAEHEPIIYEAAGTHEQHKFHCPWIKPENMRAAHTWFGGAPGKKASEAMAKKFALSIKKDLEERGLVTEKLGYDSLDYFGKNALEELGIKTEWSYSVMENARKTKTIDEINCTRMAIAYADIAYYKMYEAMKPGIREIDLAGIGMEALYRAGSEEGGTIICKSGSNTFEDYHGCNPTDRIIRYGDLITIDVTRANHMGYRTCYYRTFIIGRDPNPMEKEWYKKVRDILYEIMEVIRPGDTTDKLAKIFPPASNWGYSGEEETLASIIGHGIGLSMIEQPIIHRAYSLENPQTIEEGMIIAIETREGEPFVGGVKLEHMILITKDGCELLTNTMPDENIITAARFF